MRLYENYKYIKGSKGFTLVELLVVIAIIGILAAVITPHVFAAIEKAKFSAMLQDIEAIRRASFTFYAETGVFPTSNVTGNQTFDNWNADSKAIFVTGTHPSFTTVNWNGPYLDKWPDRTPFGGVYTYRYLTTSDNPTWLGPVANRPALPLEMIYLRFQEGGAGSGTTVENQAKRMKAAQFLREHYGNDVVYEFTNNEDNLGLLIRRH